MRKAKRTPTDRRSWKRLPLIERAVAIAVDAHAGQVDKAGEAYLFHPLRVAMSLQRGRHAVETVVTALLHDVLEDSAWTARDLRAAGIPTQVVKAVEVLSKRADEGGVDNYPRFIERIAQSGSALALAVKRADLADNADLTRLRKVKPGDLERRRRYRRAQRRLARVSHER